VGTKGNFVLVPGTDASKRFRFRSCQVKLSGSEWLLADYRNRGVDNRGCFLARESRTVEPHQRALTPFPIPVSSGLGTKRRRLVSTPETLSDM